MFTGHMLRCCENALHKLAGDKTTAMGAFFCYRVHFKAIDLTLGNMFCSLTGPGNDAISPEMFPFQNLSLTLYLSVSRSLFLTSPNTINKAPEAVSSTLKPVLISSCCSSTMTAFWFCEGTHKVHFVKSG